MQRQTLITWTGLNQANFTSPTGQIDSRTGLPLQVGGIYQGDYADFDNTGAFSNCSALVGRLYAGRYRLVQVDVNATAANVAQGLVAYWTPGSGVEAVIAVTPGSGQTPGSYQLAAVGGGGTGAVITVVVSSAGTVLNAPLISNPGFGYTTTPTFTLAAGGTPATIAAQMMQRVGLVTSYDKALSVNLPRAVFLNAITPGNYGFVQELGIATVQAGGTVGSATLGAFVNGAAGGTVTTTAATGSPTGATLGQALDVPIANGLFRALLTLPVLQG